VQERGERRERGSSRKQEPAGGERGQGRAGQAVERGRHERKRPNRVERERAAPGGEGGTPGGEGGTPGGEGRRESVRERGSRTHQPGERERKRERKRENPTESKREKQRDKTKMSKREKERDKTTMKGTWSNNDMEHHGDGATTRT